MSIYPLRFAPIFKYRIWGGEKLRQHLSKQCTGDSIGESWEISDVPGDETLVTEGPLQGTSLRQLIAEFGADLIPEAMERIKGQIAFPTARLMQPRATPAFKGHALIVR